MQLLILCFGEQMSNDFEFPSADEMKKLAEGMGKAQRTMVSALIKQFWPFILAGLFVSGGAVVGLIYLIVYLVKHI